MAIIEYQFRAIASEWSAINYFREEGVGEGGRSLTSLHARTKSPLPLTLACAGAGA